MYLTTTKQLAIIIDVVNYNFRVLTRDTYFFLKLTKMTQLLWLKYRIRFRR